MKYFFAVIFLSILFVYSLNTAQAVPPADFIFNIGTQLVQVFTFLALGFSIAIGFIKTFFQSHPFFLRHKTLLWVCLAILVVLLSWGGAYLYTQYKQNQEYAQWIEQSQQQDQNIAFENSGDNLDKLKLGEIQASNSANEIKDPGAKFVETYYGYLNRGETRAAYEVSSQIVNYPTYAGWYRDTTAVALDSIQMIDENKYSLGLTLKERDGSVVRYAVLMTLNYENGIYTVKHSDVRVLADNQPDVNPATLENGTVQDTLFFENNNTFPLSISNEEFANIPTTAFVLDAREDEEFAIGNYPGSHHLRFADIKAGEWIQLPTDQIIYVLCWSGIRGKEVADFLRSKKILARYVERGADGWVSFGGKWLGEIKFRSVYKQDQYKVFPAQWDPKLGIHVT